MDRTRTHETDAVPDAEPDGSREPAGSGCDLCGSRRFERVLESPALEGPLIRCRDCGLYRVDAKRALTFGCGPSGRTADRIGEANRNLQPLPRDEERRLNELNARWRLDSIDDLEPGARILEVGCGRGDFLDVARSRFDVCGVEPNPDLAAEAGLRSRVHNGVIDDAPLDPDWTDFDLVASFHVLEHVDSPTAFVRSLAARVRPGGLVAIETPNIDSRAFRMMGARWRQFIPEHYYFFDPRTLDRLLTDAGLRVRSIGTVGKHASTMLLMNRLSRYVPILAPFRGLRIPGTVRIDPGDILLALAVRAGQ